MYGTDLTSQEDDTDRRECGRTGNGRGRERMKGRKSKRALKSDRVGGQSPQISEEIAGDMETSVTMLSCAIHYSSSMIDQDDKST
nr:hypothetical protein CFP56_36224 [Quercus suber]